jgi:glycosyltransferase involved in cell wall biosynthesis
VFLNQSRKGAALRQVVLPFYRLAFSHRNLAVIFENPNDQQRFIEMGLISEEKTSIVQGVGVDVERFLPLPEPVGTPVVLFPARMLMDKGLGSLIEAARLLKETRAVRVVLAGEPDPGNPATVDASTLQAWQDAGLAEWWGFQAEMEAVYPQAVVVTLPSLGEGLPTALIEAAACGRAIVATDVPGCREVVEDGVNGLLVPPNEPVALAHALARLLDDAALRKSMGAAGRQRVMAQFADRLIIAKIVEIYRRLLPVEKARLLISREVDPKGGKNGLP